MFPIEHEYKSRSERENTALFKFNLAGGASVSLWAVNTKAAIRRFNRELGGAIFGSVAVEGSTEGLVK